MSSLLSFIIQNGLMLLPHIGQIHNIKISVPSRKFPTKKKFKNFNCCKDRLNDFLVPLMITEHFDCLFEVTRIVLILSHTNTQVENGFSINNDILVENLYESSIVAQHQVYDGIVHTGGVRNVETTKSMVKNVNMSHSRYKADLKRKKEARSKEKKKRKVKGRRESTETVSCQKKSRIWKQKMQDLALTMNKMSTR